MNKSIYERMASSAMIASSCYSTGKFPAVVWIARFVYANGLIADYDGKGWTVVQQER